MADEFDDGGGHVLIDALHRRHVAELPMVLAHADFYRQVKRAVGVMAGVIDFVDQRRAGLGPFDVDAMTDGTVVRK